MLKNYSNYKLAFSSFTDYMSQQRRGFKGSFTICQYPMHFPVVKVCFGHHPGRCKWNTLRDHSAFHPLHQPHPVMEPVQHTYNFLKILPETMQTCGVWLCLTQYGQDGNQQKWVQDTQVPNDLGLERYCVRTEVFLTSILYWNRGIQE